MNLSVLTPAGLLLPGGYGGAGEAQDSYTTSPAATVITVFIETIASKGSMNGSADATAGSVRSPSRSRFRCADHVDPKKELQGSRCQ